MTSVLVCGTSVQGGETSGTDERSRSAVRAERDIALDFVKGFLVLLMVLYHWLNYYIGLEWDGYRYLRFLTPSFIFITGVVVSHVYLARFSYDSPVLRRRLVQRGLKLLLLFAGLNVVETVLVLGSRYPSSLLSAWPLTRLESVLVEGGDAAFSILVPIAYFLMVAPLVLMLSKRSNISLPLIAAFAVCAVVAASSLSVENSYAEMVAIGVIGLATGERQRFVTLASKPVPLLAVYGSHVALISVLNVPFALQIVGVCVSVLLLYAAGQAATRAGVSCVLLVELGKYSLFAYVVQIAVLQVLRRAWGAEDLTGAEILIPLFVATATTVAAVRIVKSTRSRSGLVDRVYRTVFA